MTADGPDTIEPAPSENARNVLLRHAPWLAEPRLGTCIVGTAALAEACRRAGVDAPRTHDVDLAWALDVDAGARLLADRNAAATVTENSRQRGTLALRVAGHRFEVTTFRGDGDSLRERIGADLARRDMTIGAIAWQIETDAILDPEGGLEDWRARRIEPVGDAALRIVEHPVRFLRYYRRAHELDFELSTRVRKLVFDPAWSRAVPREHVAAEFRRALLRTPSPGRFLLELFEAGALPHFAPELAAQFDGRAAGPVRHHPEVSQALHLILALEWVATKSRDLGEDDRAAVMVAVLCHDLGKGATPRDQLPTHPGHERRGLPILRRLLDSLPGLADAAARRLAEQVCALHLESRRLRSMRPGTLAKLYDEHLRSGAFRTDLFALAVGADAGGRLGRAADGDRVAERVGEDLAAVRTACEAVDAGELRARFDDLERFRNELHAARVRTLRAAGFG